MYSNQKEINYISLSNVKGSAEICRPYLHKLLQFSQTPPSIPDILWVPPWASWGSALYLFLVHPNDEQLWQTDISNNIDNDNGDDDDDDDGDENDNHGDHVGDGDDGDDDNIFECEDD